MNVAQLRTFVTVVDHGSFSDAARIMGVSQPAVTMQIQALEADIGATLLDRRYRRVDLTEAGQALLPRAREVLEQIESAREEIGSLSGQVTGRLHIAASTTPAVYMIPRLLGGFLSRYPEVGVTISVDDSSAVVEQVESGQAHIGVVGAMVKGARVDYEQRGRDELIVIAHPGHPLARETGLRLPELASETWIMREAGSGTRQVAERVLGEHGVDPAELVVAVELGSGEAIASAVEGGLGIAMISRLVAHKALALGTVVELDIIGLPASRSLYVVSGKGTQTHAARTFKAYLVDALAE